MVCFKNHDVSEDGSTCLQVTEGQKPNLLDPLAEPLSNHVVDVVLKYLD
jgi:hypothetical protein